MRILIWVQHLWGVGHLRRATLIADSLGAAGASVTVVSGGLPVPEFEREQFTLRRLPAVQAGDAAYRTLARPDGSLADEALLARRSRELLHIFQETAPDVIVTELFPFGRRKFRRELVALLDTAHARDPRPLVLASVRDILESPGEGTRAQLHLRWARQYYDALLVHGDPGFVGLEGSAPHVRRLPIPLHYTGYVVSPIPAETKPGPASSGTREILVSAGGGRDGAPLLAAAEAAARRTRTNGALRWRLIHGRNAPGVCDSFSPQTIRTGFLHSGSTIIKEPIRMDLPALMGAAAVCLGRAGYNTVAEGLSVFARMILVPYAGGGQREQTLRAARLAERGLAVHLPEAELTPQALAQAVSDRLKAPAPQHHIALGGAATSARLIQYLWQRHRAAQGVAALRKPR